MPRIAPVLFVGLLGLTTAGLGQELGRPVEITYIENKAVKTISGRLQFETWPVIFDGLAAAFRDKDFDVTEKDPVSIERIDARSFLFRTYRQERKAEFAFDKIPIGTNFETQLEEATIDPLAVQVSDKVAQQMDDALSGQSAQDLPDSKEPPAVTFVPDERTPMRYIPTAAIQRIEFKLVVTQWVAPSGRFVEFSRKAKGSGGAVQVEAATFFGGPGNEAFAGGTFLPDGSILAWLDLNDLEGLTVPAAAVLGADPAAMPAAPEPPAPPAGAKGKPSRPFDPRPTGAIVRYSSDLGRIVGLTRFPWGAARIGQVLAGADGAVYVHGSAMPNFACVKAAGGVRVVENPEAVERARQRDEPLPEHDGHFIARLSADLGRIEWLVFFRHRSLRPFLLAGGDLILNSGSAFWRLSPDGRVAEPLQLEARLGGKVHDVAISPADGSIYMGGEYNSGTGLEPWRCPFLHRLDKDGKLLWTAWSWTGPIVGQTRWRQVSDSAVRRVHFDSKGDPIVLAWSDGGNTCMMNQPYDLDVYHNKYGFFNSMWGAGVLSVAHIVRMNRDTMQVKGGAAWLSYLPTEPKPNSASIRDLVVLDDGRLALVGSTAYGMIETPDAWVTPWIVENQKDPRSARVKGGPCFVMFNEDLSQLLFTSLLPGVFGGRIAARGDKVLITGGASELELAYRLEIPPILKNAIQPAMGGGRSDAYVMLVNTKAGGAR